MTLNLGRSWKLEAGYFIDDFSARAALRTAWISFPRTPIYAPIPLVRSFHPMDTILCSRDWFSMTIQIIVNLSTEVQLRRKVLFQLSAATTSTSRRHPEISHSGYRYNTPQWAGFSAGSGRSCQLVRGHHVLLVSTRHPSMSRSFSPNIASPF
jgi:hypothetical protein